jgi:hypothetical protein
MRWLLASLLTLSWLLSTGAAAQAPGPEIWFDPINHTDWLGLYQKGAPWPKGMNKVGVMALEPGWVDTASDADLYAVLAFVKLHNMKLDMDVQAVARPANGSCGSVEGYSGVADMPYAVNILKKHGARLDLIHIDEPVWFGHYDPDAGACRFSIPDLITQTALVVNSVIAIYPEVQVVEIEPLPAVTVNPDWRESMTQFRIGLEPLIGRTIRYIQLDVNWDDPSWQDAMSQMNLYLHEQNMDLGIIYNGAGSSNTDASWIARAVTNFETVEGVLGIVPAQAIFTSWDPNPLYDLPETASTAQTWLINRYTLPRTLIEAQFMGAGATGKLTTSEGAPIANATIQANMPGVNFNRPLPSTVLHGVVPAGAVSAIIGIRLNTECACAGVSDVLIGTLQYQETVNGVCRPAFPYAYPNKPAISGTGATVNGETVGGTRVTRVTVQPNQSFLANSQSFAVTANAQYQFTVPAASVGGQGWYGNIIIIWLDKNGNGIARLFVIPDPGHVTTSIATTAKDGTFTAPVLPRVGPASVPVSLYFDGGGLYRAATWTPLH